MQEIRMNSIYLYIFSIPAPKFTFAVGFCLSLQHFVQSVESHYYLFTENWQMADTLAEEGNEWGNKKRTRKLSIGKKIK